MSPRSGRATAPQPEAPTTPGTVSVALTRSQEPTDLLRDTQDLVVVDGPGRLRASELLKTIRLGLRRVEQHYASIKRPIQDALNTVRGMEKEDLAPWQQADALVTTAMGDWDRQERERVAAENRRRQQEADARARAEREERERQLREAARATQDQTAKRALHAQARAVAAAPVLPAAIAPAVAATPKASGEVGSQTHRARVDDARAVILSAAAWEILTAYLTDPAVDPARREAAQRILLPFVGDGARLPFSCLQLHEATLNDEARRQGLNFVAPGVRAIEVTIYGVRG